MSNVQSSVITEMICGLPCPISVSMYQSQFNLYDISPCKALFLMLCVVSMVYLFSFRSSMIHNQNNGQGLLIETRRDNVIPVSVFIRQNYS